MSNINLSRFKIKGPDIYDAYYIINDYVNDYKEGPFDSQSIEGAKTNLFRKKISINKIGEKFEILFDGIPINDIENPSTEENLTKLLSKYNLLLNITELKVY